MMPVSCIKMLENRECKKALPEVLEEAEDLVRRFCKAGGLWRDCRF